MPPETGDIPPRLRDFLLFFVRKYPRGIAVLLLGQCLASVCFASVPYATKLIVDTIAGLDPASADAVATATRPVLLLIACLAGQVLCMMVTWVASYRCRFPMITDMRQRVFAYVQRHDTTYFDNTLSGKIGYRATALPDQSLWLIERCAFDVFPAVAFYLVSMSYFFTIKPYFSGMVFAWLIVYFSTCILVGRKNLKLAAATNDAKSAYTGRVFDAISNIKNVIFFAAHKQENAIIREAATNVLLKQRKLYLAVIRVRLVQHVMNISMYATLFLAAIYGWSKGWLSVGDFSLVATQGVLLVRNAHEIGQMLPEFLDQMGSAQESLDVLVSVRKITDQPEARPLRIQKAGVCLENVSFSYDNGQKVIDDLSLVVPEGQKVGLIGHSGAGKSTLVSLLLRLYDVHSGRVALDGHDIRSVTLDSLRESIGLIPQETILFHRSLRDNIRYARPEATDEEVLTAAKRAHADEFISKLPKGYDTLVGERGVKLSGGQRQRIAIARAILKNAPILILDEATSALDSESEGAVQAAMADVMQGKTVIAIAHRLSTIAHLDRLIVMDKGRVVEDGTHAELLRRNGIYAQLWQRQSGGFLLEEGGG